MFQHTSLRAGKVHWLFAGVAICTKGGGAGGGNSKVWSKRCLVVVAAKVVWHKPWTVRTLKKGQ